MTSPRPARPADASAPAPARPSHARRSHALRSSLARFARDEDGSNTVEAMLMLPIMVWCFLATYVFFDAYRTQALNFRTSYVIGDMVSKELSPITDEYIDSMHDLQQVMIETGSPARLRVTAFRYFEDTDDYERCWSETRGGGVDLSTARINAMAGAIPEMADQGVGIIVQSQVDYEPVFAAGISDMSFDDFLIFSPRYAGQVVFSDVSDGNGTIADRVWECDRT